MILSTVLGGVFLLVGIVFLGLAAKGFREARRFVRGAVRAEAKVIRLAQERNEDQTLFGPEERRWFYYPVFSFIDSAGREHTVRSSAGQSPPGCAVGDTVSILYPPEAPEQARLDRAFSLWGWPWGAAVFGVFWCAAGLAVLVG